ncbi:MAG TPA: carboxypeptidase-like regulatory domain-containing protein [Gemmataceae bacterium]|nr:carboxypeptidase-like regulatory domain-containing protein [Gemmataceae bacterium]
MRPFRRAVWGCALVLLVSTGPLQAAWCNVFQVCCLGCRHGTTISAYDPCCTPCPQTVCTTRYVQRCYYQPVVTYQTQTYYEPVTTYRVSYYYEPVTNYRYSCYFDPCTCTYQQVACPVTSYRLRSQCCPVQSFVQRCCTVPVTSYRQCCYYEPVTTCCTTSVGAPVVGTAPPCNSGTLPGVGEQRAAPQPGIGEYRSTPGVPPADATPPPPPASGISFRQLTPWGSSPSRPAAPPRPPQPPPTVKLDRIVALPDPNVEGRVVGSNRAPLPGARLLFVSADRQGEREAVTADRSGEFRVTLASGGWLVYVEGADGKPVFHSKIDVQENQNRKVTLVSR